MNRTHPAILRETEYPASIAAIRKELAERCESAEIQSFDGCPLYCERYLRPDARGNLLIVHGFTEFSAKYRELIHYFSTFGYNVFIYDQRGHGRSGRQSEDAQLVHVDRFEDYTADLRAVMEQQVLPYGCGLPIDIFSHSMGGTVTTFYLAEGDAPVRKVLLSSPMVCPECKGVPTSIVLLELRHLIRKYGKKAKFPHMSEFNPDPDFRAAPDTSYARFRDNLDLRRAEPLYQSSAPTNGWIRESLTLHKRLLNKQKLAAIKAEILMLCAEEETVVKPHLQARLARLLPGCRRLVLAGGKHTLFTGSDTFLKDYYKLVFDFLE